MAYLYGWGASIVILGALFKIQHYPGAGLMLIIGLGTEAVIFFFSAFEPLHEELDWGLVYPELAHMEEGEEEFDDDSTALSGTITEQLDRMLEDAKIWQNARGFIDLAKCWRMPRYGQMLEDA